MGGEQNPSTAGKVPGGAPARPSFPEGAVDVALEPHTYPLRGRVICWLFWKCWLNPFWWVLRLVCPKRNPYRRVVAIYDGDRLDALKARKRDGGEPEAAEGLDSGGTGGRQGD